MSILPQKGSILNVEVSNMHIARIVFRCVDILIFNNLVVLFQNERRKKGIALVF
jgi:hypothetical protein